MFGCSGFYEALQPDRVIFPSTPANATSLTLPHKNRVQPYSVFSVSCFYQALEYQKMQT